MQHTMKVPGTNRTVFKCRPGYTDHIFKVVHGVELPLRVWPAKGDKAPWLLWIHGGGFQSGNPYCIDPPMQAAFGEKFHIVSLAYRYIPHVGIEEMKEDCVDGFKWCLANLGRLLPNIDVERYFVGGDSAGGTLATLMGHLLEPKPKVVLDVYGVVDFVNVELELNAKPGEQDAKMNRLLEDRDPRNAEWVRAPRWMLTLPQDVQREFWGVDVELNEEKVKLDCDLYDYVSEQYLRLDLLFRGAGREDNSSLALLDKFGTYPPTFILHGTGDSIVPVQQGYRFEKKLREMGVDVDVMYPEGEEHAFDQRLNGPEDEGYEEIIGPLIRFVERYF